jgi:type VI secretion system secreted protein VgrG
MAQLIIANITVGGHTIKNFHSVQINQSIFTHHSFEVVVPIEEFEGEGAYFFGNAHRQLIGKSIGFAFSQVFKEFHSDQSNDFSFSGIVTELSLQSSSELVSTYVIKGFSPTFMLEDGVQRRGFVGLSLGEIFGAVVGNYAIKKSINPRKGDKLDYKAQYDESNFEFINRLAEEYGEWLYYDGNKLVIGSAPSKTMDFWIDGMQNFDMSISLKPAKFNMFHHNYYKLKNFAGNSVPANVGLKEFAQFAHDESEKLFRQDSHLVTFKDIRSDLELGETISNIKAVNASDMVTFRGHGEQPNLNVGTIITVKGQKLGEKYKSKSTADFGNYRIIEITHTVDQEGNYENFFKAVPHTSSHPPRNHAIRLPIAQPEIAMVVKNNDNLALGRIKVKFYWSNADEAYTSWLRVTQAYSGGPKGMLWIPEVGDQVIIGYEQNCCDFPFVVGSVYPLDPGGATYTNKDNLQKIIRTKGGNKVGFKDNKGDQEIYITNSNNKGTSLHISFKANGVITLKTKGDIIVEAGNDIKMKAGNNFSIEATKGDVTIDAKAKNIKAKAMQNIEGKATKNIELKATMNAELSANMKVDVKGSVSAKLSGAKTSVEGQAMVTIQAPLVKIN